MQKSSGKLKYLALLFFPVILLGCQKFAKIDVGVKNNEVFFFFIKKPKKNISVKLYELEVSKLNCSENCSMWLALNRVNSEGYLTAEVLDRNSLTYGEKFPGLEDRVSAKPLVPGKYVVSGNAEIGGKNRTFFRQFELSEGADGELIVAP